MLQNESIHLINSVNNLSKDKLRPNFRRQKSKDKIRNDVVTRQSKSFVDEIHKVTKIKAKSNIFDAKTEDLDSRKNLNNILDKLSNQLQKTKMNAKSTKLFEQEIDKTTEKQYKIDETENNPKINLAQMMNKNNLQSILENKINQTPQEDLLLKVLQSGPFLDEVDLEFYQNQSLKRKRDNLKNKVVAKMIEGKPLNHSDILELFMKSMKNPDHPTLKEYFIIQLLKSDDDLTQFNLIDIVQRFINNRTSTGYKMTKKEALIYDISNSDDNMTDVDFEKHQLDQLHCLSNYTRREALIARAIKSDNELNSIQSYLEDEIISSIKKRMKDKITMKDDLLWYTFHSFDDISNLDLQKQLIFQLNESKTTLWPKDELLLKVLQRNNNLEYCDLSSNYLFILRFKRKLDKNYQQTLREQLVMDTLGSDEILRKLDLDKQMDIVQDRKLVKEPRDQLIINAIRARPSLDNIDLIESIKFALASRITRTLRDDFILAIVNSNKNLENLSCLEALKHAQTNKQEKVIEEKKRDPTIKMILKEEQILRILNDTRDCNATYMQDVEYKRLVSKHPDDLTRIERLILKCYRSRKDATDLDLTEEMMFFLKNKDKLTVKDELILKMMNADDNLARFDVSEMMQKILALKAELHEKNQQLTKKQLKELMMMKVLNGKVSHKNMNQEWVHIHNPISYRLKNLWRISRDNQDQVQLLTTKNRNIKFIPKPGMMEYDQIHYLNTEFRFALTTDLQKAIIKSLRSANQLKRFEKFVLLALIRKNDFCSFERVKVNIPTGPQRLSLKDMDWDYFHQIDRSNAAKKMIKEINNDEGKNLMDEGAMHKIKVMNNLDIDNLILLQFERKVNSLSLRNKLKITNEQMNQENIEQILTDCLQTIYTPIQRQRNIKVIDYPRILQFSFDIADYNKIGFVHLQDFEPLVWFSVLSTEIYLTQCEIDDDQSDRIDIKEFMKAVVKKNWLIDNTFREQHMMDSRKEGFIGFSGFQKFQVRKWYLDHRYHLEGVQLTKFFQYYGWFDAEKDCQIVFESMKLDKNRQYITKNEFGLWFGSKATGFSAYQTNKITSCMRRILNRFDTDRNQTLDFDEFKSLYFYVETFFDAYYSFIWMDADGESTIEFKEWKTKQKQLYLPPILKVGEEKSFKVLDKSKKNSFTLENFFLTYADDWQKHRDEMNCDSMIFNAVISDAIKLIDMHESEDELTTQLKEKRQEEQLMLDSQMKENVQMEMKNFMLKKMAEESKNDQINNDYDNNNENENDETQIDE